MINNLFFLNAFKMLLKNKIKKWKKVLFFILYIIMLWCIKFTCSISNDRFLVWQIWFKQLEFIVRRYSSNYIFSKFLFNIKFNILCGQLDLNLIMNWKGAILKFSVYLMLCRRDGLQHIYGGHQQTWPQSDGWKPSERPCFAWRDSALPVCHVR